MYCLSPAFTMFFKKTCRLSVHRTLYMLSPSQPLFKVCRYDTTFWWICQPQFKIKSAICSTLSIVQLAPFSSSSFFGLNPHKTPTV